MNDKYQHLVDEVSNSKLSSMSEKQLEKLESSSYNTAAMYVRKNTHKTRSMLGTELFEMGVYTNFLTAAHAVTRIAKEKNFILGVADRSETARKMNETRGPRKPMTASQKDKISKTLKAKATRAKWTAEQKLQARAKSWSNSKKVHTPDGVFASKQAARRALAALSYPKLETLLRTDPTNYYLIK